MVWWVPIATAVVSGISSGRKGKKAKKEAEKIATENALLVRRERQEEIRRMDRTQALRMGSARATIGARGIMPTGSAQRVLQDLEGEFQRQREFAQEVGAQREKMALEGSVGAGDAFKYSAQSSFIEAGIGLLGQSGTGGGTNSWWNIGDGN